MGVLIEESEFNLGLSLIHDRLKDVIKAYKDYLITFGTCPDMSLVDELNLIAFKMLSHDGAEVPIMR